MRCERALLIVDVQNDFCQCVSNAPQIAEAINQLVDFATAQGWSVYASRDWHPSTGPTVAARGLHCIQGTKGAEFYPKLHLGAEVEIISKGINPERLGYSVFQSEEYHFGEELHRRGVRELYIAGLLTEYCVRATALDSVAAGFWTCVIIDACGTPNRGTMLERDAIDEMRATGIHLISWRALLEHDRLRG